METVTGAWSVDELETFLTESTIPIRIATSRGDGSRWIVPLWYRYRDGTIEGATGTNADISGFLRTDDEVAFDISTNHPPYRGVRGTGTTSLSPDENKNVLESLITRYLGGTESSLAEWLLDDSRNETRISIQPTELYTWDYSDRMQPR
jgi:nitroimidazol reductase NimA-like FMN-containing flavoprotein (pyridoxamine 5'-phosphate oxidase superfamily)